MVMPPRFGKMRLAFATACAVSRTAAIGLVNAATTAALLSAGTSLTFTPRRQMCEPWFPMYENSATVFLIISRETVMFHCQLSGGLKFSSTALKPVLLLTPTMAFFNPGFIVSRLRKVGSSLNFEAPSPPQLEFTVVVHGGLADNRSTSSITFERLMKRPNPARTAVLPSPLTSQATPTRGWNPLLYGCHSERPNPAWPGFTKPLRGFFPSYNRGM